MGPIELFLILYPIELVRCPSEDLPRWDPIYTVYGGLTILSRRQGRRHAYNSMHTFISYAYRLDFAGQSEALL